MEDINQYVNKAFELQQSGEYVLAVRMYAKALKSDPSNENACSSLTDLYAGLAEYNENILKECVKTVEILMSDGHCEEAGTLADLLLSKHEDASLYCLAGEISFSLDKIDEAVKYYSHAVKADERNASYLFRLAIAFSVKGFFSEAEKCYCNAVEMEPDNLTYNYALAYLYYSNGKNDRAKKIIDLILSKDENHAKANALKILLLTTDNELFEAGRIIKRTDPDKYKDDFLFYAFAMYYSKLAMPEKAMLYLNKALVINPKATDYKYELAYFYYEQKNMEDSDFLCEEILKKNPKYIPAFILRAKILMEGAENTKADEVLKKALDLDLNTAEIYYLRGLIKYSEGKLKEACENFKTAISISPDNALYYEKAAFCYYDEEDYESACLYFKEASDTDISNGKYKYYGAKCNAKLNNKEGAIADFSVALRLEPDNLSYLEDYVEYLASIGERKKASALIKKAEKIADGEEAKKAIKEIQKKL